MEFKKYVCPNCGKAVHPTDTDCPICGLDLHPTKRSKRYRYTAVKPLAIAFFSFFLLVNIYIFVIIGQIYSLHYVMNWNIFPILIVRMIGAIIALIMTLKDDENDHSIGPFLICFAISEFFSIFSSSGANLILICASIAEVIVITSFVYKASPINPVKKVLLLILGGSGVLSLFTSIQADIPLIKEAENTVLHLPYIELLISDILIALSFVPFIFFVIFSYKNKVFVFKTFIGKEIINQTTSLSNDSNEHTQDENQ